MTLQIINCEQGTPEWFQARLGIPTASEFSTVMAKGEGKVRRAYMLKLAGEVLTGEPMETYKNGAMERGTLMEDEARDAYCFIKNVEVRRVGFIRNGLAGCSPDSLVGDDGGLEVKSAAAHIQIERLIKNDLPPEHKAQVQGSIWIAEREWWDFTSYGGAKLPPLIVRVRRDNGYIANMKGEVDRFNDELATLVETIRKYGAEAKAA
jgi:hypothetical protein